MENLGPIKNYFGLQVTKDMNGIYGINQSAYIKKAIAEFSLSDARVSEVPMNSNCEKNIDMSSILPNNERYQKLVGCLKYISVISRPDISASVSILIVNASKPTQSNWIELKRIVRYLKGTSNFKLKLGNDSKQAPLIGYADASWAEDKKKKNHQAHSGYIFFVYGAAVSCRCKKQDRVSLLSMEAEYVSLCQAGQYTIWIRWLLRDFNIDMERPTVIYEDNQSCLKFIQDERVSERTKHIDTKACFIKDHVDKGDVWYVYYPSDSWLIDEATWNFKTEKIAWLLWTMFAIIEEECWNIAIIFQLAYFIHELPFNTYIVMGKV